MELDKQSSFVTILDNYQSIFNPEDELIIKFHNRDFHWTENDFNNFISVMRSNNYTETIEKEVLECYNNDNVLSIEGLPNIVKYCMINYIDNTHTGWTRKKLLEEDNINDTLDVNISIARYSKTKITPPEKWDDLPKKYYIHKYIKYSTPDIDYVANLYKQKEEEFYSLKHSGVLKEKQEYGFFLIIKNQISTQSILQSIIKVIQSFTLSSILLTKQQQQDILNEYYSLIKNDIEISFYNKKNGDIPLITPKPITLERQNMIDPKEYGAVSILSEYTVTEKADGERILMYVNSKGNVYFINNVYKIEDTGLKVSPSGYNSIIDGEYILCNKRIDNSGKNLYAAFDIYYMNGKSVTSLPLIDKDNNSRFKSLQSFSKLITDSHSNEFIVKTHYNTNDILKDCRNILQNAKSYPYEIDGLIFTPAKLALYSYYANSPVKITDNVKWDRVFKWKPVEQNTIDFLVKSNKTIVKEGIKYKELKLYVGYNASQWEDIDITRGLKLRYDKEFFKENKTTQFSYIPLLFKPTIYYTSGVDTAYVKENNKGDIRAENGDKIEGDAIVEFRYINDPSIHISKRWVPIRVREDKTRIYKKGILSKTANELGVALNIWRSIHNPVTTAMIMGNEPVYNKEASDNADERVLESDDIYYSRNIPRDSLLSVSMLNFHNQGIKKTLYEKSTKKGSLMELCCGEAGDLNRWLDSGYNFILGIDLVKSNIYNPRSGCYSRMLKRRAQYLKNFDKKAHFPDMAFAVGDCSKSIKTGECASVLGDNDSEKLLKIVMNRQNTVDIHTKYITGKGADGFDAISCMFAIHYFFESEEKLDGFLDNVANNLKKNGVFFCTFMNGEKVEKEIENNNGDMIEGRKLLNEYNSGMPVWAIIRRYNKDNTNYYGRKIDVYIENTQRLIPEYLVSYKLLIDKAKQHGLVIEESEMFEESFNKLREKIPENVVEWSHLDEDINNLNKDNIQKQFSFLNQWVIFKKE